jgi:NhaA family Na+:H+ antiporter
MPAKAGWGQTVGVAAICAIGFTVSLFIDLLAFDDPAVQNHIKMGILLGSVLSNIVGTVILSVAKRKPDECQPKGAAALRER